MSLEQRIVYIVMHDDGWSKSSPWVRAVFSDQDSADEHTSKGSWSKWGEDVHGNYNHDGDECCLVVQFPVNAWVTPRE